jgi:hypothetical protein
MVKFEVVDAGSSRMVNRGGRPHRMGFTLSLTVRRAQIQIVTAIELNHLIDDAYAVYAA